MTPPENILTLLAEGRLIRGEWTGTDADGRKTACLLAALSPETGATEDVYACPADIMPVWLAHLTFWINDAGSEAVWPRMVRRYADLAGRWHVLSGADWTRLNYTARRIAVEAALPFAESVPAPVRGVLALLGRAETGRAVREREWEEARLTAGSAARIACEREALLRATAHGLAAVTASADIARTKAAASAAWAAAAATDGQSAQHVWDAAHAAARARGWAQAAAESAAGPAAAARAANMAAAEMTDTITAGILDAIEARIVERVVGL